MTYQYPDNGNLLPLLDQVHQNCGASPQTSTADAGYWSPEIELEGERRGIALYGAPDRQRRGSDSDLPETSPADELTAKHRMREKLRTPQGRAIYARRKAVVEPVYARSRKPDDSAASSSGASRASAISGRCSAPPTTS